MFRYADDWIIVVRGTQAQAQEIKEECKRFLQEELGLELSEEKTTITHIIDGFDFLGYHIFRCNKPTKGHIIGLFMQPTEKGLKRMKQKIKEMTDKKALNDDYLHKLEAINSLVRGWEIGRASCRERGVDLGGRRIIKKKKSKARTENRI